MGNDRIQSVVADYYSAKIVEHGPTPRGVDWNSTDGQKLRFSQLLKVCEQAEAIRLADIGCGYGAIIECLQDDGRPFEYIGYDLSEQMVDAARRIHSDSANVRFHVGGTPQEPSDFVIASGIFNVCLDTPKPEWEAYVDDTIAMMDRFSLKGFAFNILTAYSDADRQRPDLYYASPEYYFGLCKRKYSRNVALLHDYGIYEFTIVVRK